MNCVGTNVSSKFPSKHLCVCLRVVLSSYIHARAHTHTIHLIHRQNRFTHKHTRMLFFFLIPSKEEKKKPTIACTQKNNSQKLNYNLCNCETCILCMVDWKRLTTSHSYVLHMKRKSWRRRGKKEYRTVYLVTYLFLAYFIPC